MTQLVSRWSWVAVVVLQAGFACGCARSIRVDRGPTAAGLTAGATADLPASENKGELASPADVAPPGSIMSVRSSQRVLKREAGWGAGDEASTTFDRAAQCHCENRFHFTTIRAWFFRDFVPDRSDPTTLGLEFDSAFGLGGIDVANISYFEVADYPTRVPGRPVGNEVPGFGAATGINDLLTAFLFSRKRVHHGPHHFALGFAAQFPTASDSTLGSGKWSIGPSAEYEYECGRFYAAFVALNVFSVAGDSKRKDVNMFMLKPMITYDLNARWKAVYMPYGVSIYWNKPVEKAVYLPVGGGFQYGFRLGRQKMAASLQVFQYVVRPPGGSQHDLRFMLQMDF